MGETSEAPAPAPRCDKLRREPSCWGLRGKSPADDASPPENSKGSLRRSLRRGSSFSFLTPGPQWDFSLKRKRREKDDSDAVSLCSFDFKAEALSVYQIVLSTKHWWGFTES
ncbi:unnamed protein product [Pleuronectes platessa]|uniref:Uncharacterized protein n=1 Tax=Pleuronectes platessa TaxID=8262 RepID=A0A9N7V6S8_PLEPL|nr:unnamed protein product [Pleuronectes platessa]